MASQISMPQSGSFSASRTMRAAWRLRIRLGTVGFAACAAGFTASQRHRMAVLSAALRFAWISRIVAGASGRQVCPAWRRPPQSCPGLFADNLDEVADRLDQAFEGLAADQVRTNRLSRTMASFDYRRRSAAD